MAGLVNRDRVIAEVQSLVIFLNTRDLSVGEMRVVLGEAIIFLIAATEKGGQADG